MRRLTSTTGRTAVITGSSSGIGRVLALRMASEGARVAMVARRQGELEKIADVIRAAGGEASVFACDVSDRGQAVACAKRIGGELGVVDILVNNAGFGHHSAFLDLSLDEMEALVQTNLMGTLYFTRTLLPAMVERGSGWLVFMASVAGRIAPADETVYAATKHAMVGFASALSLEVEDRGVHVLTVCPGAIRTPFFDADARERMPEVAKRQMAEPEALADAVMKALARGKRELTYPGWIAAGYIAQALAPRFTRAQVKENTLVDSSDES
jgi:short-subunit dehydrogenase